MTPLASQSLQLSSTAATASPSRYVCFGFTSQNLTDPSMPSHLAVVSDGSGLTFVQNNYI